MKIKQTYLRIAGLLALAVAVLYGLSLLVDRESATSWDPTWDGRDSQPFGTHLLRQAAEQLLEPATIHSETGSPEDFEAWDGAAGRGRAAYVFINSSFNPSWFEWDNLYDMAYWGNTVWISSHYFTDIVMEDLGLSFGTLHPSENIEGLGEDSVAIAFARPGWPRQQFLLPERYVLGIQVDSAMRVDTIATTLRGTPVAVSVPMGDGQIIVSCFPKIMTNYGLLTPAYRDLTTGMLSAIPDTMEEIVWDEWIKVGNRNREDDMEDDQDDSPGTLSYIWQHEALRMALLLALTGLICLVAFQTRRTQRIIPPEKRLTNTTLEFTETVGRLYFQHQNHTQLAQKRVAAFRDYLNDTFLLPEPWGSAEFQEVLTAKSGKPAGLVRRLIRAIDRLESGQPVNEGDLQQLSLMIDEFTQHPEAHKT